MKGKKTGGRKKGTPNKQTRSMRDLIAAEWQRYQDSGKFQKDIDELEPQARIVVMEKFAQYITPKMKSVDVDMAVQTKKTIEDRLLELSAEEEE